MKPNPRTGRITAKLVVCVAFLALLPVCAASPENLPSMGSIPGAPERVVAVALQDAAIVAWLLPENSGEPPAVTSYTISAYDNDAPNAIAATAKARAPGAVMHGLTGGRCYTFRVHAHSATGNSPESEPSELTCLPLIGADIQLGMTAPDTSSAGSEVTFTLTVTNNGVSDAALVSVTDMLPAPLSSFTTSQGVCQGPVGATSFGCNLGALTSGASATVTVSVVAGNTELVNTAFANGFDKTSTALPDPVPINNAATARVKVQPSSTETASNGR